MRQIAVTLAFAVLSLGFAPAPFPKAERQAPQQRAACECEARLRELGVRWRFLSRDGRRLFCFSASDLGGSGRDVYGEYPVGEGGVPATLREVLRAVEAILGRKP
jgi:hypothetical protein